MGKVAFVTGGTGFIGSHLVEQLLQRDYTEVRCLVRSQPKWLAGLDIVPVRGTLSDAALLNQALEGVEYVYHLGAMTRAKTWKELYKANVISTMNLMRSAATANVSKVCIASSLAVSGYGATVMADESSPCDPVSRYGRSKLIMEQELADLDQPMVIIRPSVVYGPRDRDLLTFFSAINRGICVIPNHDPGLSLVHVTDLACGIIAAAESPRTTGKTYYMSHPTPTSWKTLKTASELALGKSSLLIRLPRSLIIPLGATSEWVGNLFGKYPPLNREKAREILHATKQCSSNQAAEDFGYRTQMSLEKGIQETIEWYRSQGWL